jgi:ribosomal protein L11 methyltransferase
MKHWLAVTLLIPKEFGEAISNFLIEQGATGIEELDENLKYKKLKTYFPQDGNAKRILGALQRYLKSLQVIYSEISHTQFEITSIPEQDWAENWKRFFKPLQVTSRFVVKPPWSHPRLKRGQIPIVIPPGMAFGTGTHATTKLCIQALEGRLKKKGLSVLDVGVGSGILSIVAAKLGAKEVWGIDIDEVAVEVARENVRQNGVSEIVRIRKGTIGDTRKRFDVVVANIDLKSLMKMSRSLLRHLKSGGFLILSGILDEDGDRLCQHYLEAGLFQRAKVAQEEGWICITLKKRG